MSCSKTDIAKTALMATNKRAASYFHLSYCIAIHSIFITNLILSIKPDGKPRRRWKGIIQTKLKKQSEKMWKFGNLLTS
jgi:hypothetical protein